ncbi:hypothetical protein [Streptomyces sp. D54]|uniref:hypothetical protein n=1 Tax=Streptomyces sp. D54 TaxID=1290289 RepID=UPI003CF3C8BF
MKLYQTRSVPARARALRMLTVCFEAVVGRTALQAGTTAAFRRQSHHRAAALLQSLVRLPALEHSNELYAATVAAAFLKASGHPVKVSFDQAADLVEAAANGLGIREIAYALNDWTP